jgi:hypothetical protein
MRKHTLPAALIALAVAYCSASPAQCAQNIPASSFAQVPPATDTVSLTLDWGSQAQAGQLAIADVLTYNGASPTIEPPAGWSLIRDDSSPSTRQSLYWHVIEGNDPGAQTWLFNEPVDAQGVVLLLDDVAENAPVDTSSGNIGHGGTLTADSVATAGDGDFVVAFYATDFGGGGLFGVGGIGSMIPSNTSVIVAQAEAPLEYWILATDQSGNQDGGDANCVTPQLFNWVAAQVAFRSATAR